MITSKAGIGGNLTHRKRKRFAANQPFFELGQGSNHGGVRCGGGAAIDGQELLFLASVAHFDFFGQRPEK